MLLRTIVTFQRSRIIQNLISLDYAKVGLPLNLDKRLKRVRNIKGYTERMAKGEKGPHKEGKTREMV